MATIVVAGWQHETNTFSSQKTQLSDFRQADVWPAMTQGAAIHGVFRQCNIPISGFMQRAQQLGHRCVPLLWCAATPSGPVSQTSFHTIQTQLLTLLAQAEPFDAVYLDLHGAMVAEHEQDADGAILAAVRQQIGTDPLLMASLDLHANVTRKMFAQADLLEAYRTYPHIDMADTGARLADTLDAYLTQTQKPCKAFYAFDFLIPITSQCSLSEPAAGLYTAINQLNSHPLNTLSFCPGFPLADTTETGPSLVSYAPNQMQADQQLQQMQQTITSARQQFHSPLFSAKAAVQRAQQRAASLDTPIILADTQDNPGCGGSGDTTGILAELLQQHCPQSLVACIYDPEVADRAHQHQIGEPFKVSLGEKSQSTTATPLTTTATLLQLGDGDIKATGPYYQGCELTLGQMARLKIGCVEVIVTSRNVQTADQSILRHVGAEPRDYAILALKSSVHFRADFTAVSDDIILTVAPGLNMADLKQLHYQHLQGKTIDA